MRLKEWTNGTSISGFNLGRHEATSDECLRAKLEGAIFGQKKKAKLIIINATHRWP
jgi:hypothetical protein